MMIKRRRRENGFSAAGSTPAWMVTYGDLITQILIFFVLLFSFSHIDEAKFDLAAMSLQGAFGIVQGGRTISRDPLPGDNDAISDVVRLDRLQLNQVKEVLEQRLREAGLSGQVILQMEERGLVVRLQDSVLFDSGKAALKASALAVLDRLAETLLAIPNHIRIEGHTDNLPINTPQFPSNWELSGARASNVLRYLTERRGLPVKRLSFAGYGEHRPVADNTTAEGRSRNRRVDIVIFPQSFSEREPR